MTKTKQAESLETLDKQIEEMETELAQDYGRALSWEEVTTSSADGLIKRQQRLSVLPKLLQAAKIRRLELRLEKQETALEALKAETEDAHETMKQLEQERFEAERRENEARGAHSAAVHAGLRAKQALKTTQKELETLKEEV